MVAILQPATVTTQWPQEVPAEYVMPTLLLTPFKLSSGKEPTAHVVSLSFWPIYQAILTPAKSTNQCSRNSAVPLLLQVHSKFSQAKFRPTAAIQWDQRSCSLALSLLHLLPWSRAINNKCIALVWHALVNILFDNDDDRPSCRTNNKRVLHYIVSFASWQSCKWIGEKCLYIAYLMLARSVSCFQQNTCLPGGTCWIWIRNSSTL